MDCSHLQSEVFSAKLEEDVCTTIVIDVILIVKVINDFPVDDSLVHSVSSAVSLVVNWTLRSKRLKLALCIIP